MEIDCLMRVASKNTTLRLNSKSSVSLVKNQSPSGMGDAYRSHVLESMTRW